MQSCSVMLRTIGLSLVTLLASLGFAQGSPPQKYLSKADRLAADHEDWSDLSLAGKELKPLPPLPASRDDSADFTRELVQVQWRTGDPIDLYVVRPSGVEKPPVVLYLYGYPSETDRFRDNDYCKRLTWKGAAAVGLVSALTGQRYRGRPMKEWFVSELPEALVSSVHDVQMVLNYLATRGDLDMDRVGMFGEGSGATIAILASSVDPRIKSLDLLDPWAGWPDWMASSSIVPDEERPNYVKPEFLKSVAPFDPVAKFPQVKAEHVRLQHVADDAETPAAAKHKLEAAAPRSAEIVRYDDTQHLFAAVSGGRLFEWNQDQLAGPARLAPSRDTSGTSQAKGPATNQGHDN